MIRNEANHFGRTFPQRRTRETARFVGMIEPFYAFAADRRIRTDHTVNAVGNQRIDAAQNFIVFEIGRNFTAIGTCLPLRAALSSSRFFTIPSTK